jgi:DNA-binding protein HU-beta
MSMNKNELAKRVAEEMGTTKAEALRTIEGLVSVVQNELAQGGKVSLSGFGTFAVRESAERSGRNPQTGAAITIPARKVPKFSAAKGLKDSIQ